MIARHRILVPVVLASTVLLALTGCSKASEKITEKSTEKMLEKSLGKDSKVDISEDGKQFSIKSKDGDYSVGSNVKVPDSFPAAVPTPSDAKLSTAIASDGDFTLGYSVEDWTAAVAAYRSTLTDAGFTESTSYEFGDGATYSFSGNGYEVNVTANKDSALDSGKDSLTLIVSPSADDTMSEDGQ